MFNNFDRRSAFHFAIFLIFVCGATLFILQKAEEAVAEIRTLQNSPSLAGVGALERIEKSQNRQL